MEVAIDNVQLRRIRALSELLREPIEVKERSSAVYGQECLGIQVEKGRACVLPVAAQGARLRCRVCVKSIVLALLVRGCVIREGVGLVVLVVALIVECEVGGICLLQIDRALVPVVGGSQCTQGQGYSIEFELASAGHRELIQSGED